MPPRFCPTGTFALSLVGAAPSHPHRLRTHLFQCGLDVGEGNRSESRVPPRMRARVRKDDMADAVPVNHPHRLPLKGARNVRDLGGYAFTTEDGHMGRTAFGVFVRGDSLTGLLPSDFKTLERYGVRTVIDVRSSFELRHWPDPFSHAGHPGVRYVSIPMLDQLNSSGLRGQIPRRMSDVYQHLLDDDAESLRCVMEELDHAGCTLFHCRAGKDRTGVIAMLLLGLAGVDDGDIVADYAASGSCMTTTMHLQRAAVAVFMRRHVPRSLFVAYPAEMERTLAHLHERYGTVRRYLEGRVGCAPALLDRLAARLRGLGA